MKIITVSGYFRSLVSGDLEEETKCNTNVLRAHTRGHASRVFNSFRSSVREATLRLAYAGVRRVASDAVSTSRCGWE